MRAKDGPSMPWPGRWTSAKSNCFAICTMAFYCIVFLYSIIVYGFILIPGVMRYGNTRDEAIGQAEALAQEWGGA